MKKIIFKLISMVVVFQYVTKGKFVGRFWTTHLHHSMLCLLYIRRVKETQIKWKPLKLIAQIYNGASVMVGSFHGMQVIDTDSYSSAEYIHCYAYQVNLIMIKTASVSKNVWICFQVYRVYAFFFKKPPKSYRLYNVVKRHLPHVPVTTWHFQ